MSLTNHNPTELLPLVFYDLFHLKSVSVSLSWASLMEEKLQVFFGVSTWTMFSGCSPKRGTMATPHWLVSAMLFSYHLWQRDGCESELLQKKKKRKKSRTFQVEILEHQVDQTNIRKYRENLTIVNNDFAWGTFSDACFKIQDSELAVMACI